MQAILDRLRQLGGAIIDPYLVIDAQQNIIDFNGAFYSLFPRQVARRLKKMRCCEALKLDICQNRCIGLEAMTRGTSLRYDEVTGTVAESGEQLRLIGSATPVLDDQGQPVAALIVCRNVTDEAKVQAKYKSMLEEASRDRQTLLDQLATRTRELLTAQEELSCLEEALLHFRKGLWEPVCLELDPHIVTTTLADEWEATRNRMAAGGRAGSQSLGELSAFDRSSISRISESMGRRAEGSRPSASRPSSDSQGAGTPGERRPAVTRRTPTTQPASVPTPPQPPQKSEEERNRDWDWDWDEDISLTPDSPPVIQSLPPLAPGEQPPTRPETSEGSAESRSSTVPAQPDPPVAASMGNGQRATGAPLSRQHTRTPTELADERPHQTPSEALMEIIDQVEAVLQPDEELDAVPAAPATSMAPSAAPEPSGQIDANRNRLLGQGVAAIKRAMQGNAQKRNTLTDPGEPQDPTSGAPPSASNPEFQAATLDESSRPITIEVMVPKKT